MHHILSGIRNGDEHLHSSKEYGTLCLIMSNSLTVWNITDYLADRQNAKCNTKKCLTLTTLSADVRHALLSFTSATMLSAYVRWLPASWIYGNNSIQSQTQWSHTQDMSRTNEPFNYLHCAAHTLWPLWRLMKPCWWQLVRSIRRRCKSSPWLCYLSVPLYTLQTFNYSVDAKHFEGVNTFILYRVALCLQCFDTVGWAAGRASGL